jgi:hypothetical protein
MFTENFFEALGKARGAVRFLLFLFFLVKEKKEVLFS